MYVVGKKSMYEYSPMAPAPLSNSFLYLLRFFTIRSLRVNSELFGKWFIILVFYKVVTLMHLVYIFTDFHQVAVRPLKLGNWVNLMFFKYYLDLKDMDLTVFYLTNRHSNHLET